VRAPLKNSSKSGTRSSGVARPFPKSAGKEPQKQEEPAPQQDSPEDSKERGFFHRFARITARAAGNPWTFNLALAMIGTWLITGPIFHYSDTWQLVINTATTIVTFLMVFLIQNTQNRDCEAIQLKLDELIRASQSAHNSVLDIEELSENELDRLKAQYECLAAKARNNVRAGKSDLECGEVPSQTLAGTPK
jgi:low affinity Fe/Cu permease